MFNFRIFFHDFPCQYFSNAYRFEVVKVKVRIKMMFTLYFMQLCNKQT